MSGKKKERKKTERRENLASYACNNATATTVNARKPPGPIKENKSILDSRQSFIYILKVYARIIVLNCHFLAISADDVLSHAPYCLK